MSDSLKLHFCEVSHVTIYKSAGVMSSGLSQLGLKTSKVCLKTLWVESERSGHLPEKVFTEILIQPHSGNCRVFLSLTLTKD